MIDAPLVLGPETEMALRPPLTLGGDAAANPLSVKLANRYEPISRPILAAPLKRLICKLARGGANIGQYLQPTSQPLEAEKLGDGWNKSPLATLNIPPVCQLIMAALMSGEVTHTNMRKAPAEAGKQILDWITTPMLLSTTTCRLVSICAQA